MRTIDLPIKDVCELYLGGASTVQIASMYGVSDSTVVKRLNGLVEWRREMPRRNVPDDSFFSVIDSEVKAYYLGLLMSDGNVFGNCVRIQLQSADIAILRRFALEVGLPNKAVYTNIRKSDGRSYSTFALNSSQWVSDLRKYGIVENKCFKTCVPELKEVFQRHFWRGMVDGDGSLFVSSHHGNYQVTLELAGTNEICQGFSDFLKSSGVDHNCSVIGFKAEGHHTQTHYAFRLKARLARAVIKLLYDGNSICLDRKGILASELPILRFANPEIKQRKLRSSKLDFWKRNRSVMVAAMVGAWSGDVGAARRSAMSERMRLLWFSRRNS